MSEGLPCPRTLVHAYRSAMVELVGTVPVDQVAELAELILRVTQADGVIYTFGNGGSASTAGHIGCDFLKNTQMPGAPQVRCIDLGAAVSNVTAFANDNGYDQVFAAPLHSLGRASDLAIAVSTSGNSPNVLEGLRAARRLGMHTAALLGFDGGQARHLADLSLVVQSESVTGIENIHLIICHMLTECLRSMLEQAAPASSG